MRDKKFRNNNWIKICVIGSMTSLSIALGGCMGAGSEATSGTTAADETTDTAEITTTSITETTSETTAGTTENISLTSGDLQVKRLVEYALDTITDWDKVKSCAVMSTTEFKANMEEDGAHSDVEINAFTDAEGNTKVPYIGHAKTVTEYNIDGQLSTSENEEYSELDSSNNNTIKYEWEYDSSSGEAGKWEKSENSGSVDVKSYFRLIILQDIVDGKIPAGMSETNEKINGKDADKIIFEIPGDIFCDRFSSLGMYYENEEGIAHGELYLDKETGLPIKMIIDAKDFGVDIIQNAFMMDFLNSHDNLNVNTEKYTMVMELDKVNGVEEVKVPDDVIKAAE